MEILNIVRDRELVGKAIVLFFFSCLILYGLKAVLTKRIALHYRRLKELHRGESAVIWGIIFVLAGALGVLITAYGCTWFSTC